MDFIAVRHFPFFNATSCADNTLFFCVSHIGGVRMRVTCVTHKSHLIRKPGRASTARSSEWRRTGWILRKKEISRVRSFINIFVYI